jgi:hypothetical protein
MPNAQALRAQVLQASRQSGGINLFRERRALYRTLGAFAELGWIIAEVGSHPGDGFPGFWLLAEPETFPWILKRDGATQ